MSKNVLSVIICGLLSSACDRNDRRPLGGGTVAGEGEEPVGHGEGGGAGVIDEGEGGDGDGVDGDGSSTGRVDAGPGHGEGEGSPDACDPVCAKLSAQQEDYIPTCVAGICQCYRNLWRDCGPQCEQIGDDTRCIAGFCANPDIGFIECNARCVDSLWDNTNCGACGNVCGENEQCVDGQCSVCPDARERWCPKRWEGFECVNLQNDQTNCGACGVWCNGLGYECVDGVCVCKPEADRCAFEGAELCTDLTRDWNNCGECGHPCPRGSECFSGQCGDCVQSWDLEQCNGNCIVCDGMADVTEGFDSACVITATDEMNCGRCGNRCAENQACEASRCMNRN